MSPRRRRVLPSALGMRRIFLEIPNLKNDVSSKKIGSESLAEAAPTGSSVRYLGPRGGDISTLNSRPDGLWQFDIRSSVGFVVLTGQGRVCGPE